MSVVPYEQDFAPDAHGLREALRWLIEARSVPGSPHVDPALPLDVGQHWPAVGLGGLAALEHLRGAALEQVSRLDHPGFFAHMDPPTPRPPPGSSSSWWSAGWRRRSGWAAGTYCPARRLANLTALWAARDLTGARRVVCSNAAHLSIAKAARVLGLELVEVPVDAAQRLREDMLPDDLSDAIVVLIAGTVATGAVDPLGAAQGAAWRHVDAGRVRCVCPRTRRCWTASRRPTRWRCRRTSGFTSPRQRHCAVPRITGGARRPELRRQLPGRAQCRAASIVRRRPRRARRDVDRQDMGLGQDRPGRDNLVRALPGRANRGCTGSLAWKAAPAVRVLDNHSVGAAPIHPRLAMSTKEPCPRVGELGRPWAGRGRDVATRVIRSGGAASRPERKLFGNG